MDYMMGDVCNINRTGGGLVMRLFNKNEKLVVQSKQRTPQQLFFYNNKLQFKYLTSNHVVCRAVLPVSPPENCAQR